MAFKNAYLASVMETVKKRNGNEPEFIQAVQEVLESFEPVVDVYKRQAKSSWVKSSTAASASTEPRKPLKCWTVLKHRASNTPPRGLLPSRSATQ